MKSSEKFKLMDGVFQTEDAKSLIVSLYNDKIFYHSKKLLQARETNRGDVKGIEERIAELEAAQAAVVKLLSADEGRDKLGEVKADIMVSMLE